MKCPKCHFENSNNARLCLDCGVNLHLECPRCKQTLPFYAKYCDECGEKIESNHNDDIKGQLADSERKLVTILFSDITGYTTISEKLDPEEVKEFRERIFADIRRIVAKYEGVINKYIGDAVLVFFGVPQAHEDDPVRAIRAAKEIHDIVAAQSPRLLTKIGCPLSMHSGINTGLVVTGELSFEGGKLGVTGDTVNVASRLAGLAKAGEIIVDSNTYKRTMGYFSFAYIDVKGLTARTESLEGYKVIDTKETPEKIHRLAGRRSNLIGRQNEISFLRETIESLQKGKGSIVSIIGDAGTGKSRLLEEVSVGLVPEGIKWHNGHAFAYSQNIPYYIIIDFINRAFSINEGDSTVQIKDKIALAINTLVKDGEKFIPYIGSLYAIAYPETENISPKFWRTKLQEAFKVVFSAMAESCPIIICFEDIHWADPSSIELLYAVIKEQNLPILFLLTYRPSLKLGPGDRAIAGNEVYSEIMLHDLDPLESQTMVESLLETKNVPEDLKLFILEEVEGNPFFLEETINNLIESETLVCKNDNWIITKPINRSDIPSSIQGVIAARLDRLEINTKRILREASVIGREFIYEILEKVTASPLQLDESLALLEELDLIRKRQSLPELEYIFKHVLTQDVAYNGLLIKERQVIHERIGSVMEEVLDDRIPELYEKLAYHFKEGQSTLKAVDYLIKSGWKSQRLYAVEESNQYYHEAFELLSGKSTRSQEEDNLLIVLLVKWASVYSHRGDYRGMIDIFKAHEAIADKIEDWETRGMFYAWFGWALKQREKIHEGYDYLKKALHIGETRKNDMVIAYSCAWLCHTCGDLGRLDEAVAYGERAHDLTFRSFYSERDLVAITFSGIGQAYCFKGYSKKTGVTGKLLYDYGCKQLCFRCQAIGYWIMGMGHSTSGDFPAAIESYKQFIEVSPDPLLIYTGKCMLGMAYLADNQVQKALPILLEVIEYDKKFGMEYIGTISQALQGAVLVATGHVGEGIDLCESAHGVFRETGSKFRYAAVSLILGKVYLALARKETPFRFSFYLKNFWIISRNIFSADKKAAYYLNETATSAREAGLEVLLGQAYMEMGQLHRTMGRTEMASSCFTEAAHIFEACEAYAFLQQAWEKIANMHASN